MYLMEVTFERPAGGEEGADLAAGLIDSWRAHGQALGLEHLLVTVTVNGHPALTTVVPTHEADSLEPGHDGHYARNARDRLQHNGVRVTTRLLGQAGDEEVCRCATRTSLILETSWVQICSPLACGDCQGSIPLYRLPPTSDHGYLDVLSWARDYGACDTLQMSCTVAEFDMLRQMWRPDSELNREGRAVAARIGSSVGLPVYYYLHRYYARRRETRLPCPGCGGAWRIEPLWHSRYEFRCDSCLLISRQGPSH